MWKVYIVKCSDDTLYTGITKDLDRRLFEHNSNEKGAKYTSIRRPVKLVYSSVWKDRSEASKEEIRIKSLTKKSKLELINKSKPCKNYIIS